MKKIIIYISLFLLFVSCATYNLQQNDAFNYKVDTTIISKDTVFSFYLVGDAGKYLGGNQNPVLTALKKELQKASSHSSVIFLGDNIYPKGLPKKHDKGRSNAESIINSQIDIVKNYKGKVIFIPGNHDWRYGVDGIKRQAKYIEKALNNSKIFFPANACPLKQIKINDAITLIIIDSQWYLENWDDEPKINDDCSIKTRDAFFLELESLLKKNEGKTTVIAIHHPMFSNGPHGGQYSFKQQLRPLPLLGSLVSLLRKTGGVSPQDLQNKRYLELRKRVVTLAQANDKIIFVSGHEHSLQYLVKDNVPQIISGSASKISATRNKADAFSYGDYGYAKLIVFKDGSSEVLFYNIENKKPHLVYQTTVIKADKKYVEKDYPLLSNKMATASIYTRKETTKKKSYRKFWGERYRYYYSKEVNVPLVNLDTLFGGLTPIRKGGGHQTKSLRLVNKKGEQYVMRALKKSAVQYLQAVVFKDQYIEGKFEDTSVENILSDFFTGSHPYAPLVVGTLADAVAVYHTNPKLYYIPKQKALKVFNDTFGDELYIIEERVTSGHGNQKSFGYADKIISTNDLLTNLRKNSTHKLDEASYIRARLFDMLIGDWDRHEDQWRWAQFKDNTGNKIYKPVPRDRDQAFSKMVDGSLLNIATSLLPTLRFLQSYEGNLKDTKWFNVEVYPLDMALINNADKSVWDVQVAFIQKNLTNTIIDEAFDKMPQEVRDSTAVQLKQKLKSRRKNLQKIANSYYKQLNRYAVIKGTDKDDWFDIIRLPNGKTRVKGYRIIKSKKEDLFFDRTFNVDETKEIWIYGLDDKDVFAVSGKSNKAIKIRLIGGQNNDTYTIKNGKKIIIYDYKTKKNTFITNKGKLKLSDSYKTNVYNYKKPKYNVFQIMPSFGANKDDGFKIGTTTSYTLNKFERNPFTQQHVLMSNYYFSTSGFELKYTAEFANIFNNWNFRIETDYTSPNYSINFFGFGNDSENRDDELEEDYNRVKIRTFKFSPSIVWRGQLGAEFKIALSYESKTVDNTPDRFISLTNQLPTTIFEEQRFLGAQVEYNYENYNDKSFPTLGMKTNFQAGYTTNKDSDKNFAYFIPSISFDYKLGQSGKVVLATKLKAHINFGDGFEFYQAASIGANDGLRGFRNQRFTGKSAFYQNTDLRIKLKSSKSRFMPLKWGIYGGFDYGRVWVENNDVNIWHTSYGGGIWLDGAGLFSSRLALFNSTDGALISFGLGFGF